MELKITKEKVLEAALKCSTAKATLTTLFPECFEKEETFKKGDKFTIGCTNYILARCGVSVDHVALISLSNGNVWADIIHTSDCFKITKEELKQMLGCKTGDIEEIIKTKH